MDNYIYVTFASNDPTRPLGSTPSDFSNTLSDPIRFDGAMQVALAAITFRPSVSGKIVLVNSSIAQQSVVVGSQYTQEIRRFILPTVEEADLDLVNYEPQNLQFVPAATGTELNYVEVTVTDQDGGFLPMEESGVTFVTFALRRV